MNGLQWEDVQGLFERLDPAKQFEFTYYLYQLMQESEGNSQPQPCDSQE